MTNQRQYESQYDDVEKCTTLTSWETHSIVVDSARVRKLRCNLLRVARRSNVLYSIARFVIWILYGITMKETALRDRVRKNPTYNFYYNHSLSHFTTSYGSDLMMPLKWQAICNFAWFRNHVELKRTNSHCSNIASQTEREREREVNSLLRFTLWKRFGALYLFRRYFTIWIILE